MNDWEAIAHSYESTASQYRELLDQANAQVAKLIKICEDFQRLADLESERADRAERELAELRART